MYVTSYSTSLLTSCLPAVCCWPPRYLTPAGSQGLAPHHDDVELWVVQTSGTKKWRLYEPINGYNLPNAGSGDLEQSVLGPPVMEVELAVGDCLYMPRGTVHQAEASGGIDSSHLTISTYQRCSYADLATHLLQVSVQKDWGSHPHALLQACVVVLVVSLIVSCLHKRAPTIVVLSRLLNSFSSPVPPKPSIRMRVYWCCPGCVQVGLSVQEEEPRSLPLAARFSPAPGTLLQHSLHHVLAQESPATSTTPDAVGGLAGVRGRHCC